MSLAPAGSIPAPRLFRLRVQISRTFDFHATTASRPNESGAEVKKLLSRRRQPACRNWYSTYLGAV